MRQQGREVKSVQWEHDIKMDFNEIGWGGVDWMGVAEDTEKRCAVVNTAMNLLFSYNAERETFRTLRQHAKIMSGESVF
jgi:hypothetical protein